MEEVSCIFCQAHSNDVVIVENGFTGVKCHNCNLIFISPRPDPTEVTRLYSDGHAVLYADAQFKFERFNSMEAARTLAKIRSRKKGGGTLLEIGPGGGSFLSEARANVAMNPMALSLIQLKLAGLTKICAYHAKLPRLAPHRLGGGALTSFTIEMSSVI